MLRKLYEDGFIFNAYRKIYIYMYIYVYVYAYIYIYNVYDCTQSTWAPFTDMVELKSQHG